MELDAAGGGRQIGRRSGTTAPLADRGPEIEAAIVQASAADRDRMERAVDVLALAAQKTAAVLGASHPQALATLRAFAGAEYEAAALLVPGAAAHRRACPGGVGGGTLGGLSGGHPAGTSPGPG